MDIWNIDSITSQLQAHNLAGGREAESVARWIWEDILLLEQRSSVAWNASYHQQLTAVFERLSKGEPIQYIAGYAWFYGLKIGVNPGVLIPRPETEELVEWVLEVSRQCGKSGIRILDIGTGSGCIPIVLKKKLQDRVEMVAIDISAEALTLARKNSEGYGLEIDFIRRDYLKEGLSGLGDFDIIVSNPPYISKELVSAQVIAGLQFEPAIALYPEGTDPDIFYRRMSEEVWQVLENGGSCMVEMNEFRAEEIKSYFQVDPWEEVEVRTDLQGQPRMLKADFFKKN